MPVDAPAALLCWYDVDKRRLPWRAQPGESANPYYVWLSEIMLQQTTIAHARPYFDRFVARWPDVAALAAADEAEIMAAWAGLGYYARARNLAACARRVVADHGGHFPGDEAALRQLPGIGRYTAAAIAAIAFGRKAVPVEANVARIVARLFAVKESLPAARRRIERLAADLYPEQRVGDFAQALMDLGQAICTPRDPNCTLCPMTASCLAWAEGDPGRYPVRAAKAPRPRCDGVAYWLEHGGRVLLIRRPAQGLLGGMLALPTDSEGVPAQADWHEAGAVEHAFTHFELRMRLLCAQADTEGGADGIWWPVDRLAEAGLPTLFAKLAARGAEWRNAA